MFLDTRLWSNRSKFISDGTQQWISETEAFMKFNDIETLICKEFLNLQKA